MKNRNLVLAAVMVAASAGVQITSAQAGSAFDLQTFKSCAQQVQRIEGGPVHHLTLTEARRCAPGIIEIKQSDVATADRPAAFVVVLPGGMAAFEQTATSSAPTQSVSPRGPAIAASCYNTWTTVTAYYFDVLDWGNLTATGYGNHCNYANIPNQPTVSASCACTGIRWSQGRYDSVWDSNNYGVDSAGAWANIVFTWPAASESWFCRDYIDTNGNHSPGPYCA